MNKHIILFCILFVFININTSSQTYTGVLNVSPEQDCIGAARNTLVTVELDSSIGSFLFDQNNLFRISGSSSGLVKGIMTSDTNSNKFIFAPENLFFCGEIINVSFGPLINKSDSSVLSFNWRFSVEITNPTKAEFDSLKRFNCPSYYAMTYDYDKDGDIDIISANGLVIYNDGYGSFEYYELKEEFYQMEYFVDVNNDKIEDIITHSGCDINVSLGDGSGNYSLYQNISSDCSVVIAKGDINGDGFIDLIEANNWGEDGLFTYWNKLLNDGTGKFFADDSIVYIESYIYTADLVDMNKDGYLDLVLMTTSSLIMDTTQFYGAYVYYNNGLGDFNEYSRTPFLDHVHEMFIADYDKNGLNDIAGYGSTFGGVISLQQNDGTFSRVLKTEFYLPGCSFTSGDINGDNRFDLVISNSQVCIECGDTGRVTFSTLLNYDPLDFYTDSTRFTYRLGLRKEVGSFVIPLLADVDNDGDLDIIHSGYPTTITYNQSVTTGIETDSEIPESFVLYQNYPNPFNNSTKISYLLPSAGRVRIIIYNVLGEQVELLKDTIENAGEHTAFFDATDLSSGLYLYRIEFNKKNIVKKMIYLK